MPCTRSDPALTKRVAPRARVAFGAVGRDWTDFHPTSVRCRLLPAMKRWPILRAAAPFQEAILARYLGCRNSFLDPPPHRVPYLGKCVSLGTFRFERMARVPNHDQVMGDGQP